MTITSTLGKELVFLVDREQDSGIHSVIWNVRAAGPGFRRDGVLFCRLRANGCDETAEMILVRNMQ